MADDTMGNEADGDVPSEEDGAGMGSCWADGCLVFEQCPLLAGRQVMQALPAFTHAFLQWRLLSLSGRQFTQK